MNYATYQETLNWIDLDDEDWQEDEDQRKQVLEIVSSIESGDRPIVKIDKRNNQINVDNLETLYAYQYLKMNDIPYVWIGEFVSELSNQFGGKYLEVSRNTYTSSNVAIVKVIDRDNNLNYIAKCDDRESLLHQYIIGIEVNKLKLHYMMKTYDYASVIGNYSNFEFLITEDMTNTDGKVITLYEYMDLFPSYSDLATIFMTLAYMCIEMNSLSFTHYDLWSGNILINVNQPHKYQFQILGESISINCPVTISIIDFQYSYHPNAPGPIGKPDPIYDISKLVYLFHWVLGRVSLSSTWRLIKVNNFSHFLKDISIHNPVNTDIAVYLDAIRTDLKSYL